MALEGLEHMIRWIWSCPYGYDRVTCMEYTLYMQCLQQLLALKYAITEMIILRKVRSNRRMAENIIFPLDYGWAQSENNIP